jgi:predicted ATP-dependent protease
LSGLPVNQAIAVTGSVNQKGEVQAIGGVNEKVEGYFEICQASGMTGDQGVLIPESNVVNLMLKESVINAIRQGKFHIWPVRSIDEGIEELTGVPAGVRLDDGSFESGSVNALVNQRLRQLAETLQRFGKEIPAKTPDAQKNNEVDKANDAGDGE